MVCVSLMLALALRCGRFGDNRLHRDQKVGCGHIEWPSVTVAVALSSENRHEQKKLIFIHCAIVQER